MGSRVTDATSESWTSNAVMPGPSMCRLTLTNGLLLIRVCVSLIPVTCANASTPLASSICDFAADLAPKTAKAMATRTSATVMNRPTYSLGARRVERWHGHRIGR